MWKLYAAAGGVALAALTVLAFQGGAHRVSQAAHGLGPHKAAAEEALARRDRTFGRDLEHRVLVGHDDQVRRRGDFLFISRRGADIARFRDLGYCDGFDQCSRWRFIGVLKDGRRREPVVSLFAGATGVEKLYRVAADGRIFVLESRPALQEGWLIQASGPDPSAKTPATSKDRRQEIAKGYQRLAY